MPWTAIATASFIALFFGLGFVWPRQRPGASWPDVFINVVTGGALFGVRQGLRIIVAVPLAALGGALVDLAPITHPALQALLLFVLLDFSRYWLHYADHRVPWLWTFHRVHHSIEHLDSTSGLRMHVVDIVQLTLLPALLFGVLFDISSFHPWVLPGVLMVGAAFDAFEHANIAVDFSRPLPRAWNLLLNNPHFHSWHHTREGAVKDGNYGQALTIWDRMFGTDVTEPLPPEEYGLDDTKNLQNKLLALQLLQRRVHS